MLQHKNGRWQFEVFSEKKTTVKAILSVSVKVGGTTKKISTVDILTFLRISIYNKWTWVLMTKFKMRRNSKCFFKCQALLQIFIFQTLIKLIQLNLWNICEFCSYSMKMWITIASSEIHPKFVRDTRSDIMLP